MKLILIPLFFTLATSLLTGCSSKKKSEPLVNKEQIAKSEPVKEMATPPTSNHAYGKTEVLQHNTDNPKVTVQHTHWSYNGLTGPDMWGDLKAEYSSCKTGMLQSPIDLIWHRPSGKRNIEMQYKDSNYHLVDNGHTIQAVFEPGNSVSIEGQQYVLVQMHFHAKSEHTISGKQFPLEAHFVHKDHKGHLAVLGVLFTEGRTNPYLESMWEQFPKEKNRQVASTKGFNPENLIPKVTTHYNYNGSLTTPPCSEGVSWNVFNTPLEVSREQLDHFRVLYANNYRPIQPSNARKLKNF